MQQPQIKWPKKLRGVVNKRVKSSIEHFTQENDRLTGEKKEDNKKITVLKASLQKCQNKNKRQENLLLGLESSARGSNVQIQGAVKETIQAKQQTEKVQKAAKKAEQLAEQLAEQQKRQAEEAATQQKIKAEEAAKQAGLEGLVREQVAREVGIKKGIETFHGSKYRHLRQLWYWSPSDQSKYFEIEKYKSDKVSWFIFLVFCGIIGLFIYWPVGVLMIFIAMAITDN